MKEKTFIPQEYDVFAGLDVDKKSISVTFSSHQQGFIRSLHMPYSVEHLLKHVRKNFEWLNNFDHQIFSAEVRLIKPDLAIYQHCLQRLGVQPPEALFVDDRERNVQAARAVGITGIRFQSVEQLRGELEALGFTILPSDSSCQLGSQR